MLNISKKRYFPEWEYFVYDLTRKQRGDYLNVWFPQVDWIDKRGKHYPRNHYWTLKKCDQETSYHLYCRIYNPVSINIMPAYRYKEPKITPFDMKAQIHSIDDSSYGIWFQDMELSELTEKRLQIMRYVDYVKVINGEEFLKYCLMLGANLKSIDYN